METLPETLRDNVRLIGELLGETLQEHEGLQLFKKVEEIRSLSKAMTQSGELDTQPLVDLLSQVEDKDILPIVRAFNQFLNLANIAELEYFSSAQSQTNDGLEELLVQLTKQVGKDDLVQLISTLSIDLVLTAHPTEVTRRTLIRKYESVANTLSDMSRTDLIGYEKNKLNGRLHRLVEEIWNTDEIRTTRPTAVDEAKWGFAVIENSLWRAIPDFLRHFDRLSRRHLGTGIPINAAPFQFYSWMGGDRDGNPNVTHTVTSEVIWLGRWQAADLYYNDIHDLGGDLSMYAATDELMQIVGVESKTPYRDLLNALCGRLSATKTWITERLHNDLPETSDIISSRQQLLAPLLLCHRSLVELGYHHIANGPLIDTIRRIYTFGINLSPLDIRQDGDRHVQAFEELTEYLDLGHYREWDEATREKFLLEQLESKRPLIPFDWDATDDTNEVLATCRVIAAQPAETLSHYVISMAKQPSDVLAVALLLKECGVTWQMPIVPLFETLDDLDRAPKVMNALWQMHWYQRYSKGEQTVMIGYSDSAKDAGKFAATWAQYKSQEKLVSLAEQHSVSLTLFHGRGGTVGRGGGPVEKAMASQPPGSVKGRIRVTEQGEMIRYKFGLPRLALSSLSTYAQATLKATVTPSPAPSEKWRLLIEEMAAASLKTYRSVVQENPNFVPYFRSLTPEQELGKLALGSRPAKRKATGGVESLRAIPWVFAWTQVRLNLPSWLGIQSALQYAQENAPETLAEMVNDWPFFSSFLDLLEMVVGKADLAICAHYEKLLVSEDLHAFGQELRNSLAALEEQLNQIKHQAHLLDDNPMLQVTLNVRKPYVDPLNYLQAELLKRERKAGVISPQLDQALKVTMAGIAAGMRNTG
jgi:phosphoenolpyruvate carboxylase